MKISVVVPVLNEEACLPDLLLRLRQSVSPTVEVLLVDGGSTDQTVALAEQAGFSVTQGGRGRARQMNLGATLASGDILLFLHADNILPGGWQQTLTKQLIHPVCWGRFDVRIQGKSAMLPVIASFMNLRSRLTGIATGDQAMFMTRKAFQAVGGFPDQALMEDIEMSKRLLRLSRPACLASQTTTSGRRWETRGVWTTILLMWHLRWRYWRGQLPSELARDYA